MADRTTETTTNKPDLLDCDALMLSSYLLHHRFEGDAMKTAHFLLEATSTLPNAEEISAQLMGEQEVEEAEEKKKEEVKEAALVEAASELGSALTEQCTVSMTTPRGKFQMTLYESGIRCVNAKNQVVLISPQAVERMVMFPKPEDCRSTAKPSGDMVLLCLDKKDSSTQFNGKALTQLCLQLPKESPLKDDTSTSWLQVLCSSLSLNAKTQVAIVHNPKNLKDRSRYAFKSHDEGTTSSTTAGMPYVQCYYGVKDGVLYPMQEGLLFFKPPMFLHRSTLHSIACGRGSGGSRYVDMSLTLDDETPLEFTNIHRDELAHLNGYIHSILIPAMKKDAIEDSDDEVSVEQESSEEEEESGSSLGKRKRTQRKASKEARQATKAHMERTQDKDDSDDEEDEGWEGVPEGEESDDDDDEDFGQDGEPESAQGAMALDEGDDDDEEEEEEFFEEENSGTATESDDE